MTTLKKSPYWVDIHDIVHRPGEVRQFIYDFLVPEKLGEGLLVIETGTPLEQHLKLESIQEGILVTARVDTTARGECGRCLREIERAVEVEFQELFAYPSDEAFEYEVHDDHVNLEPLLRDTVVLSLPFQPVCEPDCPGLDPETGERLAEHPDRVPQEVLDPRWMALARFEAPNTNTDGTR
jgi:uncharacterized protein